MEKAIKRWSPLFVLPTLLAFTIGFIIPFFEGLYLSFCQFTTVKNAKFTGFGNYKKIFSDLTFLSSFKFTVLFAVASIVLINVIAFALALLLTRKLKGTNIFRTIFFMPNLIGGIVLGYIWQILINCVLSIVGQPLLALNSSAGYWGLIILMCWQQIGYMMIIYIAGLQAVPEDMLEAAKIDGANEAQRFFKITLPYMKSVIKVTVSMSIIENFKQFPLFWTMTGGGPNNSTTTMAILSYREAFVSNNFGSGAAVTTVWMLMMIAVVFVYNRIFRKEDM